MITTLHQKIKKTLKPLTFIALMIFMLTLYGQHYGACHILVNSDGSDTFVGIEPIPEITLDTTRITPKYWKYVPFLLSNIASTIPPYVYLPEELYNDVFSESPDPNNLAIVIHETVHQRRSAEKPAQWLTSYLLSRKIRLHEELISIATEMEFRRQHGLDYDIPRKAKHFSGSVYAWTCTNDDATTILENLWDTITTPEVSPRG